jgi:predicted regulator of Ras-like GTPase activity (Roadblock/LC7/MglB family)
MEKIVEEMKKIKAILGFVLVRNDGSLLESSFPPEVNSKILGVMAAAIVKSSVISSKELKIGEFSYALLKASKGFYLCTEISPEIILGCLIRKKASLNQVIKTVQNLKNIYLRKNNLIL